MAEWEEGGKETVGGRGREAGTDSELPLDGCKISQQTAAPQPEAAARTTASEGERPVRVRSGAVILQRIRCPRPWDARGTVPESALNSPPCIRCHPCSGFRSPRAPASLGSCAVLSRGGGGSSRGRHWGREWEHQPRAQAERPAPGRSHQVSIPAQHLMKGTCFQTVAPTRGAGGR